MAICSSFFIENGERPLLEKRWEAIIPALRFAYQFVSEKIEDGGSILDYGCGGGYGSEYLSRKEKWLVTGFDINEQVVAINQHFFF